MLLTKPCRENKTEGEKEGKLCFPKLKDSKNGHQKPPDEDSKGKSKQNNCLQSHLYSSCWAAQYFTEWEPQQDVQVSAYNANCTGDKHSVPENSFITGFQTTK